MSVFGTDLHIREDGGLDKVGQDDDWFKPPSIMVSCAVPALLRDEYTALLRVDLYDEVATTYPEAGGSIMLDPEQARALRDVIDAALARNEQAQRRIDGLEPWPENDQ